MSEQRAFGDRLRRQRERRGVTLEAIARSTKVSASLFAALERGDCSRWPGGVYSRAYIRAYAEAIGMDPNEAVEDFTATFADPVLPDAPDAAKRPTRSTAGSLRLSMDDQPELRETLLIRRTIFALADLAAAIGLAWIAHALLQTGVWGTAAFALAYYAGGRVITDEPLIAWIVSRFHSAPADLAAAEDVSVSDPARTAA